MTIGIRRWCLGGAAVVFCFSAYLAQAQAKSKTALDRQLERIDLSLDATGTLTTSTTGNSYLPQTVNLVPSNTVGALAHLRYTRSALMGFEINYGFARYTDNYTVTNIPGKTPAGNSSYVLGAQARASEYSVGYVLHAPGTYFGLHPFGGVGAGALYFTPTAGGGQGLPKQPRAMEFYEVGADAPLLIPDFGVRVEFRQQFFGAPDYDQNYLATGKRSVTSQPTIGFWYRF